MKKEQKSYYLVEYCGPYRSVYNSIDEVNAVLDEIRKYNRRKNERYIIGNANYEEVNGKYVLIAHLYNKLLPKSTISELDNYTKEFNERELIINLFDKFRIVDETKTRTKKGYYPDINIAYFEDKKLKYIPVLYKDDIKYLDRDYIFRCIDYHCYHNDITFFEELLTFISCLNNNSYNFSD